MRMGTELVSRALKRLEADGAIDAGADIRILDRERLKRASE
ncbi:MAG: helix-turn-helix domain-containing protein [Myxococcales bacterium]|nr:helix-turn-helix domain-containing protein [Myxococcales bacterium]